MKITMLSQTMIIGGLCLTASLSSHADSARPLTEVEGAHEIKVNGGWCWYQGPRAIVTQDGQILFTTIAGDTFGGTDAGDLWISSWNPETGNLKHFELHDKFHRDDHDVAGLLERPDERILAVYGKHGQDTLQRWRITSNPHDITAWEKEESLNHGAAYTYSNVYQLSAENGRIYNFCRARGYNPNCSISDDNGKSWKYGWRLFSWKKDDLKDNPLYTGVDGCRPYLRYTSNNKDTIHFVTTEDHPRAYDNSIYHGYYKQGKLYNSAGEVVGSPGLSGDSELKPTSFTRVFEGGPEKVAWTVDIELDENEHPYTVFSVQLDGAKGRGQRLDQYGNDHRYYYARYDGKQWNVHQMAFAGTKLYTKESDYTGLVALDPQDPDTVIISTNAHPATGKALISSKDQKRHWELFRGKTSDQGKSWKWEAITRNSDTDNLRPLIPSNPGGKRHILWARGDMTTFTDYRLNICHLSEPR
ncbi:BNR-4 repeat-containing protein [Rubritalea squalenifaciens]|nr:BNR-4 repeat-containing protein [Rubritalea squalenifaciens]